MRKIIDLVLPSTGVAVDVLAAESGLPKQRIKDAMAKGACWWNYKGKQVRLRKAKRELKAGTRLQLFYDEQVLARTPEQPLLLADHGHYSFWYKPHGLLAQGSQWGDHCALLRLAEQALARPCFLVHRLDADAAGLMVIAHDPKAAAALSQCFVERTMTKVYQARVTGLLDSDNQIIDAPLDNKASISRITTLSQDVDSQTTLLQVTIETGRKHQIRQHLAGIGHPIVNDRLYGKAGSEPLQLTAVYLSFDCPLLRRSVEQRLPPQLNKLGG
ncbi:MAG: RluA family pseudouridine synthase [Marinobacter sp.]|nr:RluA family pseudouridine synthase [Marinobacter sp.]